MKIVCAARIEESLLLVWHAHAWAIERLIAVSSTSGDIRWTIMALAWRSLVVLWRVGRWQSVLRGRRMPSPGISRLATGLASGATDADSMVAAGGR